VTVLYQGRTSHLCLCDRVVSGLNVTFVFECDSVVLGLNVTFALEYDVVVLGFNITFVCDGVV